MKYMTHMDSAMYLPVPKMYDNKSDSVIKFWYTLNRQY